MNSQIRDLTGQLFGRLIVIKFAGTKNNKALWLCQCSCGEECVVVGQRLSSGTTQSCGCYKRELHSNRLTKHGMDKKGNRHPLYKTWCGMKRRCYNPNEKAYKYYGGKGIKLCDRWKDDFQAFYDDTLLTWVPGLTIERIDFNGDYSPENCLWISHAEQMRNMTTNRNIEYQGQIKCLSEWAEIYGLKVGRLWKRLKAGWSMEKALNTPVRKMTNRKLLA